MNMGMNPNLYVTPQDMNVSEQVSKPMGFAAAAGGSNVNVQGGPTVLNAPTIAPEQRTFNYNLLYGDGPQKSLRANVP